jgi:enoyl-CoA hydratase
VRERLAPDEGMGRHTVVTLDRTSVGSSIEEHVAYIKFENPARHNALTLGMVGDLIGVFERLAVDKSVQAIVILGGGVDDFCSGADISEFEFSRSTPALRRRHAEKWEVLFSAIRAAPQPVVAAIQGSCLGGGLLLALNADIRIGSDSSRFAIPAARLGVGYGFAGVAALASVVGSAHASDILFTARRVPAVEALPMGLLNFVVPASDFEGYVSAYAQGIAQNAPLTVQLCKEFLRSSHARPTGIDMQYEQDALEQCDSSVDYAEGRRAFLEKRSPYFGEC